jgi:hypothetical protein
MGAWSIKTAMNRVHISPTESIYCVYFHLKKNSDEVFYVGIGTLSRAKDLTGRSKFWKHVYEKHGCDIQIKHEGLTWIEACDLERIYIAEFGRRDIQTGTLVNHTDGGEGNYGWVPTDEHKIKLSEANKANPKLIASLTGRKLTDEHKANIGKGQLGIPTSDETKAKQSAALMGRKFDDGRGDKIAARLRAYNSKRRVDKLFANLQGLGLQATIDVLLKHLEEWSKKGLFESVDAVLEDPRLFDLSGRLGFAVITPLEQLFVEKAMRDEVTIGA